MASPFMTPEAAAAVQVANSLEPTRPLGESPVLKQVAENRQAARQEADTVFNDNVANKADLFNTADSMLDYGANRLRSRLNIDTRQVELDKLRQAAESDPSKKNDYLQAKADYDEDFAQVESVALASTVDKDSKTKYGTQQKINALLVVQADIETQLAELGDTKKSPAEIRQMNAALQTELQRVLGVRSQMDRLIRQNGIERGVIRTFIYEKITQPLKGERGRFSIPDQSPLTLETAEAELAMHQDRDIRKRIQKNPNISYYDKAHPGKLDTDIADVQDRLSQLNWLPAESPLRKRLESRLAGLQEVKDYKDGKLRPTRLRTHINDLLSQDRKAIYDAAAQEARAEEESKQQREQARQTAEQSQAQQAPEITPDTVINQLQSLGRPITPEIRAQVAGLFSDPPETRKTMAGLMKIMLGVMMIMNTAAPLVNVEGNGHGP